eukprot:8055966-Karenia_brevis.AAC.1
MGTAEQPAWTGDHNLPSSKQGLMVLGTPVGTTAFIEAKMREVAEDHSKLLHNISAMNDLQSAWLLL